MRTGGLFHNESGDCITVTFIRDAAETDQRTVFQPGWSADQMFGKI